MRFAILALLLAGTLHAQTTIAHVSVIDTNGGPTRHDMTVTIKDGRIASVAKSDATSAAGAGTSIDGRGKFLIPGLWDMHVHLSWTTESALPLLLAKGITGVRDLGGHLRELDAYRAKIDAGLIAGPRILRAGPSLNGRAFNPLQLVAGTPDEARGVVRTLKHVGVDFLKTHRRTPRETYFAMVDEAKKQGLDLVGHIPMTVSPEEASDAGQTTIEHTETLFEGTFAAGLAKGAFVPAVKTWRENEAEKLFARFVKNNNAFTPNLIAYRSGFDTPDPSRAKYVAASLRKLPEPLKPEQIAEAKQLFAELLEVVRVANRSGVTILAGSDVAAARVPGFMLHDELELLVAAGLTPMQALQAATRNPARVLKLDAGTIEPGKLADLVLLDADPLADIRNTQRIAGVVANGKFHSRAAVEALMKKAEELAATR